MDTMTQDEKKNESKSKTDAMVQDESQNKGKSKMDISIEKIDAIFMKHGLGGKSVWGKVDPNHHRVIIRFQGKKKD